MRKLEHVTRDWVGRRLAILVDGEIRNAPVVKAALRGAGLSIPSRLGNAAERNAGAVRLAAELRPWQGAAANLALWPDVRNLRGASGAALETAVDRWIRGAGAGRPETMALQVGSSAGWGCACPPFVLRDNAKEDGRYFLFADVAEGVLDPEDERWHPGPRVRFVLEGVYTTRRSTLQARLNAKGMPAADESALQAPVPIFQTLHWCLIPPPLDARADAGYQDTLRWAKELGVLCPTAIARE